MGKEIIDELIGIDLRVLTNKNEEKTLRFIDLKNCKDVTISYDYYQSYKFNEFYRQDILLPPVLKEIKITIPCNGYSLEVLDT